MNLIYCTLNHNINLVACVSGLLDYYYSEVAKSLSFKLLLKAHQGWRDGSAVKSMGLFFQRTHIQCPAPTWRLTTVSNSSICLTPSQTDVQAKQQCAQNNVLLKSSSEG